jgi:hypothetical protein
MKLIIKAFTKKSDLLFELEQDTDIAIGLLLILNCEKGSISGAISLEGTDAIFPEDFKHLNDAVRLSALLLLNTDTAATDASNESMDQNYFYSDSLGGIYRDRKCSGLLYLSVGLTKIAGQLSFDASVVEKNDKTTLKYDHFVEDVTDPFILVDLHL